ncbi:MAG TPA: NAD-dependent epimerase/dehydratase family protein [Rhodocyclaceae bacterium]|jgi:dTDP-L-rhamnose 4-epimerase|nr:NAD-dependent epimerase/dehydratase family protein [Rhodocyclaceae bacterium]HNL20399.1 NAD-dependent epimerase/dehydratase family protein [Rhodocyclaceae bacterium]HNM20853.1 NAD-dependent epimerase/dehydratase family protein [Rhodocyclaceae bacterium]HNM80027.1 NAD-dependent epimerase/dehydratase family protein [Rhodocyclaceae bacterium]HNP03359.1 NAD-dependent epimerase/dehydratase family protein [Rhodocyclaceae bacterium]
MAHVLITGGAGFIGRHLVRELIGEGHRVRILDILSPQVHGQVPRDLDWLQHPEIELLRGSTTCRSDLEAALQGVQAVVHLAAETGTGQSMYQIAHYNSVNAGGTALLLDILANSRGCDVQRVVLASSRSIYGEGAFVCTCCSPELRRYPEARAKQHLAAGRWEHVCTNCGSELSPVPTREDDPAKPASIYAATKYAQEELVRIACGALGVDHAILRLQNVYGEGQSLNNPYTGILSIFSTRVRRGQNLPIFEDGRETRDFVHVEDVARAFARAVAAEGKVGAVINVGTGVRSTVAEIAEQLSLAFDATPRLIVTGEYRIGDIRHNFAEIEQLSVRLHYTPSVALSEGMARFAAWVKNQPLPEDRLAAANAELRARNMMG